METPSPLLKCLRSHYGRHCEPFPAKNSLDCGMLQIQCQNVSEVIPRLPQREGRSPPVPIPSTAKRPLCLDPAINFRLVPQRFHCSSFTTALIIVQSDVPAVAGVFSSACQFREHFSRLSPWGPQTPSCVPLSPPGSSSARRWTGSTGPRRPIPGECEGRACPPGSTAHHNTQQLHLTGIIHCNEANFMHKLTNVGGVAQWLGRQSLAGGLSLIYAWW